MPAPIRTVRCCAATAAKVFPQKASVDSFQCVTRCSGMSSTEARDSRMVVCINWWVLYSVTKSGSPCRAPVVCVDPFPSRRELRLPVLEMKDESTERQTADARCWLEREGAQKDDDE